MEKLHSLQQKIYEIYQDNRRVLPTFREIAKKIGVSSTNTVAYHIKELKKRGYLGFPADLEKNAVLSLNIKNLLNLEAKAGVYVILESGPKQKRPIYVGKAEDIKKDVLEQTNNNSCLAEAIKKTSENIEIAFYLISEADERSDLKNHLIQYYREQGAVLC